MPQVPHCPSESITLPIGRLIEFVNFCADAVHCALVIFSLFTSFKVVKNLPFTLSKPSPFSSRSLKICFQKLIIDSSVLVFRFSLTIRIIAEPYLLSIANILITSIMSKGRGERKGTSTSRKEAGRKEI